MRNMIDQWLHLLLQWIQHCLCAEATLAVSCFQPMSEHGEGTTANPSLQDASLLLYVFGSITPHWLGSTLLRTGLLSVTLPTLSSLFPSSFHEIRGLKPPSTFSCSSPPKSYACIRSYWHVLLSGPKLTQVVMRAVQQNRW